MQLKNSLQVSTFHTAQRGAAQNRHQGHRPLRGIRCEVSTRPTPTSKESSPISDADGEVRKVTADVLPESASVDIWQSVDGDEPVVDDIAVDEVVVLLLATATGLATGLGVVLFNNLVHQIQDHLVWTSTPRLAAFGSNGLYRYPSFSPWQSLLLPPVVGGVVVAVLRGMAGGFTADPPGVAPVQQQSQLSAVKAQAASDLSDSAQSTTATAQPAERVAWSSKSESGQAQSTAKMTSGPTPTPEVAIPGRFPRSSTVPDGSAVAVTDAPVHSLRILLRWKGLQYTLRPYIKLVASAITLGSGASMGPEGPSVELGKATAERITCAAREQV